MLTVSANSVDGQIDQLSKRFAIIEKSAKLFEGHERRGTTMLHGSLQELYDFGETLFALPSPPGTNITAVFLRKHLGDFDKRTQANPYIGLVKLAFSSTSDSSRSQYAKVLEFAASEGIAPKGFVQWLQDGGIEGKRAEAMKALASRQHQKNNQGKLTRFKQAEAKLLSGPISVPVALPAGVEAPEGFALVLVRVDGSNNASIVQVVEAASDKVDPIVIRLGDGQAPTSLGTEPLSQLHRAIDIILSVTPDKAGGEARDILIRSIQQQGKTMTVVEAISSAYTFPGANVVIPAVHGLSPDACIVLSCGDAGRFRDQFEKHDNWALESDEITADNLARAIPFHPLQTSHSYRVAATSADRSKAFQVSLDDLQGLTGYLAREREEHSRRNKKNAQSKPFPASIMPSVVADRISLMLPDRPLSVSLGATSIDDDLSDVTLAVADLAAVADTLGRYEITADGWIMDSEVNNAGFAFETYIDDDKITIVIPTRIGSDYNQVCMDLAA